MCTTNTSEATVTKTPELFWESALNLTLNNRSTSVFLIGAPLTFFFAYNVACKVGMKKAIGKGLKFPKRQRKYAQNYVRLNMLNPKVNKSILACYGIVIAFFACKGFGLVAAKSNNVTFEKVSGWVNDPWI